MALRLHITLIIMAAPGTVSILQVNSMMVLLLMADLLPLALVPCGLHLNDHRTVAQGLQQAQDPTRLAEEQAKTATTTSQR